MALSKPQADETSPDYNFEPILRVIRKSDPAPVDFQFSITRDALFMLDELMTDTLKRARLGSSDLNTEIIFARIDVLLLNITKRLFNQDQAQSRQLVLNELRSFIGMLNAGPQERVVPVGFVRSVGSIWWIMPDDELYELMFQSRMTSNGKLRSFDASQDINPMFFRGLTLFTQRNPDAVGIRIYPSVVPEKFDTEEGIDIPFSLTIAFYFEHNVGQYRSFIETGTLTAKGAEEGGGVVELEYILPCPSTCP